MLIRGDMLLFTISIKSRFKGSANVQHTYRFEETIVWERWCFLKFEINIDYRDTVRQRFLFIFPANLQTQSTSPLNRLQKPFFFQLLSISHTCTFTEPNINRLPLSISNAFKQSLLLVMRVCDLIFVFLRLTIMWITLYLEHNIHRIVNKHYFIFIAFRQGKCIYDMMLILFFPSS